MPASDDRAPDTVFFRARDGHCYTAATASEADAWIGPGGDVGDASCAGHDGYRPVARVDVGGREPLTLAEAIALLAPGQRVHSVMIPSPGVILGAMWDQTDVEAFFRQHGAEIAGPRSSSRGYGVAATDGRRWVFFETRTDEAAEVQADDP